MRVLDPDDDPKKKYINILRTEAYCLVRSHSSSRWKSYVLKYPKDRSLLPGSITFTEQVETLCLKIS